MKRASESESGAPERKKRRRARVCAADGGEDVDAAAVLNVSADMPSSENAEREVLVAEDVHDTSGDAPAVFDWYAEFELLVLL